MNDQLQLQDQITVRRRVGYVHAYGGYRHLCGAVNSADVFAAEKLVIVPYIFASLFIPYSQVIVLAGLHFNVTGSCCHLPGFGR